VKWRDTDYHSLERCGSLYPSTTYLYTMVKMLLVFVSQSRFKRTAMGGASDTTRASVNARLSESRQEKFIDDACTRDPDPTLGDPSGMSRDDEADELSCFAQPLVRTVVERGKSRWSFCVRCWEAGQVQAGLNLGRVQQSILFAARDICQAGQVGQDCSSTILS
jgi:hypothetical protein